MVAILEIKQIINSALKKASNQPFEPIIIQIE